MGRHAPPPPESWAGFRAENRKGRAAEPGLSHVEAAEPTPQLYTVVGPHSVWGVDPGGVVELALPEGQASALIEAGHIEPLAADSGLSPDSQEV